MPAKLDLLCPKMRIRARLMAHDRKNRRRLLTGTLEALHRADAGATNDLADTLSKQKSNTSPTRTGQKEQLKNTQERLQKTLERIKQERWQM
jgi:hypothetical protein